jgi:hypothetical protein
MLTESGQKTMMEWPEVVREFARNRQRDITSSDSESTDTNRGVELPVLSPAVKAKYDAFWSRILSSVKPPDRA